MDTNYLTYVSFMQIYFLEYPANLVNPHSFVIILRELRV